MIEDEESFIEALVVGLKREGFLVTVARDGIEGLAMFDRVRPDLVLLDIWLPHKSGIDVCRELRPRTRVPIIMVTAKSSEIDTVVGLEVGADDYVTKPYRLRELVARMRAVLRRSPSADNEESAGEVLEVGGLAPRSGSPRGSSQRRPGPASAQGVRAAGAVDGQRRPGPDPRDADRPDLGPPLRRRHQDPRRAREAAPGQDRGRPGPSGPHHDHPGPGLQVRGPALATLAAARTIGVKGLLLEGPEPAPPGQSSGRSIRASHSPGASSSAGVGSSRSERHSRPSPSSPARSTMPRTNACPRS